MPRQVKTSFNAGEFSERLYGRVDLEKYASGCKTMRNFVAMPHGGATRRPGTRFIAESKTSSKLSRLIPFQFSTEQAYIIEAGDLYMRFCMDGGQILSVDSYTKLLLHFEGEDASKDIVDSGATGHVITPYNNAQIDTEEYKFSGSSLLLGLNGQSDYISIADHDDFYFPSGLTIDGWFKFATPLYPIGDEHGGMQCLWYQGDATATDHIALFYCFETKRFYLLIMDGGTSILSKCLGSDILTSLPYDKWYHFALIRGWGGLSDRWALVINGVGAFTFDSSAAWPNHSGDPRIGEAADTKIFDFGNTQHPITRSGSNMNIATTSPKLGRGSLVFNGTDDYLSMPNHADWDILTTSDLTIDIFVQHASHATYQAYLCHYEDDNNYWLFFHDGDTTQDPEKGLGFAIVSGGTPIVFIEDVGEIDDSNWHHIAVCKVGNIYGIYKDGVQVGYTSDTSFDTFEGGLYIGRFPSGTYDNEWFDGCMKNIRIEYSNVFGANPQSDLSDTITIPTKNPTPNVPTRLLIFGEPKRYNGWIDEDRVSNKARWTAPFTPPTLAYPAGDGSGSATEIVTTYTEDELQFLRWVQSADVLYITSPDRCPRKLTRTSHTAWSINDLGFDANNWPPFLDKNATATTIYSSADSGDDKTLTASTAIFTSDMIGGWIALHKGYCKITNVTSPPSTTATVNIIKNLDTNYATPTADWWEGAWSDKNGWPTCVTFYEDRLCFAGTEDNPDRIDLSTTSGYENFYRAELDAGTAAADDAMVIYLSSRQVNAIRWLAGTRKLLAGTTGGEWWIDGGSYDEALDGTKFARRHMDSERGSANVAPVLIDNRVLYIQRLARTIREFYYNWQDDQYLTNDLSVISEHLTNRSTIRELAWQQSPHQILWSLRADGVLLALTYMREHEVVGWSRIHIAGSSAVVESIATIEGSSEDEVWLIVRRNINGSIKRYVERIDPFVVVDTGSGGSTEWELTDAFFLDSGLTYRGSPTSEIGGLAHLEGESVVALADGVVQTGITVESGSITLPSTASVVHVGLNSYADLETLWPIVSDREGLLVGYPQKLSNVVLMVYKTAGGKIGADPLRLTNIIYPVGFGISGDERVVRGGGRRIIRGDDVRIVRGISATPDFYTGLTEDISIEGGSHSYPTVYIRQDEPLPMSVVAVITDLE